MADVALIPTASHIPTVVAADVQEARNRIKPYIHQTPLITSSTIDKLAPTGCHVLMKCENLQKVGAFKIRGATNALLSILASDPSLSSNPSTLTAVTHSSGNYAQAVALASSLFGVNAHIVMPSNAPSVKKAAVLGYGATITECSPVMQMREETTKNVMEEERRKEGNSRVQFMPSYNDVYVVAGQGTLALEFLEQASSPPFDSPLDILITPVGGGGLISGCAVAAKSVNPDIVVIGAEPKEADDAQRGFRSGKWVESKSANTVADGLRTSLGDITFELIKKWVYDIYTVTEEQIINALRLCFERLKMVVEPSGAVPLAVVLYSQEFADLIAKTREKLGRDVVVGIVFSGGNVELSTLLRLFESVGSSA